MSVRYQGQSFVSNQGKESGQKSRIRSHDQELDLGLVLGISTRDSGQGKNVGCEVERGFWKMFSYF